MFYKKLFILFTFLLATSLLVESNRLPNIVFILTDDQGYADVGYHGSPIPTPNIDALANGGIKLENYYTHPMCTPSRAALLTGKYAANVQLSEFALPFGGLQGLDEKFTTLPQALKKFGYATHMVGKWHLGNSKKKYLPTRKGFDSFFGTSGLGINHITKQVGNGMYDLMENEDVYWENKTHATDLFGSRAIEIIERQAKLRSNRPLFLYLAFTAPHDPLIGTPQDMVACSHITHYIRRKFCSMVHGVDRKVGDVIKSLEDNNLMDNTIIVFSSDNGGSPWVGGFNYPFRGAKMSALEGGSRVPAFIYGPKFLKEKSGSTYDGLFHIADWYPTLLSFANKEVNPDNKNLNLPGLDGVDQRAALIGESDVIPRDRVQIHHSVLHKSHVYRRGPWKLILGQHGIPLAEVGLYREPINWIVEDGNICDTFAEMAIWFLDLIFGLENSLTSFRMLIGGVANRMHPWWDEGANMIKMRTENSTGIFVDQEKQDLRNWTPDFESKYLSNETNYPLVALYHLKSDPGERENLAGIKRNLVTKLIKEAAELLDKDALPLYVGDMLDNNVPKIEGLSPIFVQSSNLAEVVPCLPWLDDDVDVTSFPDDRLGYMLRGGNQNSVAFQLGLVFALWALTPIVFMYSLVLCC